ncbi:polyprenyl synthetase family protein [Paenibacillus terrigena]|uniref:polyprenyl synthetase family protein n=1 Tax=Paenibacillus terrigena TaxID=369333 RepID=UPI0003733909|nr:polyprenyl synthetase family protein [Paenibacillus terrigena]
MKLSDALHIDVDRIDKEMIDLVRYDRDLPVFSVVKRSVLDLIQAGGKRLRPMLVIVGSRFGTREPEAKRLVRLAAAAEFVHAASLIHDDIIDGAERRRQQPTLHTKTNNYTATHVANYMMARIVEALFEYSDTEEQGSALQDLISAAPSRLCLGEYQQLNTRFDYDIRLDTYLEKTMNKTALLMATCLQIGARTAEADESVSNKLYAFGRAVGMSFQIKDDLLDFEQSEGKLGKPAGADLMNGQVTLPVIYALREEQLGDQIRALHEGSSVEEFQFVIDQIRSSPAMDQAKELSHRYMHEAWKLIEDLREFKASQDLETIWHYFNDRDF